MPRGQQIMGHSALPDMHVRTANRQHEHFRDLGKEMRRMERTSKVKKSVFIGIMGAVSTVLMLLNFSLPFVPGFLKFDISELPALFAGFFLGPASGCMVIVIKVLLKLLFEGSDTAYVGELMNIMGSVSFILPASLIYRWKHTKKGAIVAMAVSADQDLCTALR